MGYGLYLDFALLPPEQAQKVTVSKDARLYGSLDQSDWEQITGLLARIKVLDESEKEIAKVTTAFEPFTTVATQVELTDGKLVTFIKETESDWRLIGITGPIISCWGRNEEKQDRQPAGGAYVLPGAGKTSAHP